MALEILKTDTDRITGYITMHLRIRDADGTTSVFDEGIDHESLTVRYNCPHGATAPEIEASLTRWLAERHPILLSQHRAVVQRSGVVSGLAGKTLNFGEAA